MYNPPLTEENLERMARRRVRLKMAWYRHALTYVLVIGFLAFLSLKQGRDWFIWPALGWGIGLLAHAFGTFMGQPGSGFHQRLVEKERERLQAAQRAE